jgi:hypothetical protein
MIAGKLGSNQKATFIVRSARTVYGGTAGVIILTWYTAWRNERVAPGEGKFPFPNAKLRKRFTPDRPNTDHDLGYQSSAKTVTSSPGSTVITGQGKPGPPDWGGAREVAYALVAGLGLKVSSSKRSGETTSTGGVSDHWVGCKECFALDNEGSVAHMDRAAIKIMSRLGAHYNGTSELVHTVEKNGFRIQVLYRTYVGGNHYTHIHVGVRKVGYEP